MSAPRLDINLDKITHNARMLAEDLGDRGIAVTGITKAALGSLDIAKAMLRAGMSGLGDSRIENIEAMRQQRISAPIMLIRSPMLSQVNRVVRNADISFNTELTVVRRLASDEEDFEPYRGQNPYVLDAEMRPVGVISLHSMLTSKRSVHLSAVMTPPITLQASASLDEVRDAFDKHAFLGLPVVEADGRLVGVVSRSAIDEAVLERSESDVLKRYGLVGVELRP